MSYDTGLSMEERVTSLFQPDTLMPEQYLETFRRKLYLEPEKKLLLAVLEDAISCFQKYLFSKDGKGKALFLEAQEWILDEDTDWLFSFANVCEMLGFEPSYLRDGLLRWKSDKLDSHSKAKVYQIAVRTTRQKREVSASRRSTQRMRKTASR
jgi:hypothetical protein